MVTDAGLTFGNSVVILGRVGISGSTPGLSAGMSLGAMGHHGTGHGRVVQDGIVMIGGQVVGVTMMTMTMLMVMIIIIIVIVIIVVIIIIRFLNNLLRKATLK